MPRRAAYPPIASCRVAVRTAGMIATMATLFRAEVEHVAYLVRLGLSEDELTRLEGQLNHILDQYEVLARLDTEAIPPTAQTIELENILRDDEPRPSLPAERVLAKNRELYRRLA